VAGQVAFDAENRVVGLGDPHAQAEQVWRNIASVVESAGGSVRDVVKITVFLSDIRHAGAEIDVRRRVFADGVYPICTQVQVANLGLPELLMEVDAIAVLDGPRSPQDGST
jgi:enamine deaminase RidA (YjgF/YER057c/UK114 family)